MNCIAHLEFHEILTGCNCKRDTCGPQASGMLFKYVEAKKYCIYYTKLQNAAYTTKRCKMMHTIPTVAKCCIHYQTLQNAAKMAKLQSAAVITFSWRFRSLYRDPKLRICAFFTECYL